MIKILFALSAIALMFSQAECSSPDSLKEEIMFEAFNNGYKIELSEEEVNKIDDLFTAGLKGSYPMPALGVSLHDYTMEAIEEGIWLRFAFPETITVNELEFDQLLINITNEMYGFNIIRGNNGVFEGRNFYINLNKNLNNLYDYLLTLPITNQTFTAQFEYPKNQEEVAVVEEVLKIKEVSLSDSECSECEDCEKCEDNISCEDCKEQTDCEKCSDCKNCEEVSCMALPSINKDNKDKSNGVIEQSGQDKEEESFEHLIQYSKIQKTLLKAIKF